MKINMHNNIDESQIYHAKQKMADPKGSDFNHDTLEQEKQIGQPTNHQESESEDEDRI